ncbi:MAG: hypothetical protein FVQ83_10510 [Chloroflexi bacterium]|nr:hypothetical protein [Chloroflexota bacterium]
MHELYSYRSRLMERYSQVGEEVSRAPLAIPKSAWQDSLKGRDTSPNQLIACLHALENQLFKPGIFSLLDSIGKPLPLFDVNVWLETGYKSDVSLEIILNAYLELHTEMDTRLQDLPIEAWTLTGRHPWWGCRTLQWWVESNLVEAEAVVGKLVQF